MKLKFSLWLFILLALAGCSSQPGIWGWYVIDPRTVAGYNNIRFLLNGFGATILLSLIAAGLSIPRLMTRLSLSVFWGTCSGSAWSTSTHARLPEAATLRNHARDHRSKIALLTKM